MPAAAWMTIAVAGLIIAIAAVGLLRVIFHLRAIRATLRAVTGGVQAVDALTATVPVRLTSVNANLKPVRDFCEGVLCPCRGSGGRSPGKQSAKESEAWSPTGPLAT